MGLRVEYDLVYSSFLRLFLMVKNSKKGMLIELEKFKELLKNLFFF